MVAKSTIERQEFNEIRIAQEYAYQVGQLLKDKLGKLMLNLPNYYPDESVIIAEGVTYSTVLSIKDTSDNSVVEHTLEYVAVASDGVTEVLEGLSQWVTDNASDSLIARVFTDYTSDSDKHMFFVPLDGFICTEVSKTNLSSDDKLAWVESTVPASYLAYGKQPTSSLPRLIITPTTQNTVCALMEDDLLIEEIEGIETDIEYTSSYIDYSLSLTCEAGSTDDVLRSGVSSQNILNTFRKMMTNEIIRKNIQNSVNSVAYPITSISPLPLLEQTQFMDMATCTADFSAVDMYIPEDTAGFIEATSILGSTVLDDGGSQYKYTEDGAVVIFGQDSYIDRRLV